ncbi:MAG TPA: STAS/SEC14 domain-containing protein [Longimicrobiales bacterium]|nr:STAS/SEC14 domain-containing protein [Longimicrobiales bacterium]
MPVHYARSGAVLVIAVDGDFTVVELQRVVERAGADPAVPNPARVLLDLSGAASLARKSDQDLSACAALFAGAGERFQRVAVLVAGDLVDDLMRMGTAFVSQDGVRASPFRSRADAEEWLRES